MNRLTLPPAWRRLASAAALPWLYWGFVLLFLSCAAAALLREEAMWWGVPLLVPVVLVLVHDWRWLYHLLLLTLAFSHEIHLPNGFSLDVPSEPLMLLLTGCSLVALLVGAVRLPAQFRHHTLVLLVVAGWLWAATSTLFSVDALKSVKYLLAKLWYLVPFGVVTYLVVRRPADAWRAAGCYTLGAVLTTLYAAVRHAQNRFAFDAIHDAIQPFYRNHVIYATTLALLIPYAYYGARQAATRRQKHLWQLALGLLVFGVLTSYTRASMLALPLLLVFYAVIRWRLTRWLLLGVVAGIVVAGTYLVQQNQYLVYAPEYEQTIFNGHDFEKHLEATYELKDVSGMERVYRWIAAVHMFQEKPLTGTGPSTFYPEYKHFTVKSFRTYVSNNPEHSTTHNYFLLLLAEQGLPGLLLFLALVGYTLLLVEKLYRQCPTPALRCLVLASGLSFYTIVFHLLLNELVEVDKVGSFFFIALVLLIRVQEWSSLPPNTLEAAARG